MASDASSLPIDFLTPQYFARLRRYFDDEPHRIAKKLEFGLPSAVLIEDVNRGKTEALCTINAPTSSFPDSRQKGA